MAEQLPSTVAAVLEDFQTPLPTATVRVLCSVRRGAPVSAEALSRLAAAQREEYLRRRLPPRLCHAIDEHGRAPVPRVWALGSWRLARRIITPDALDGWRVGQAHGLCREVLANGPHAPAELVQAAGEATARVLGPLVAYRPEDASGWSELLAKLSGRLPGPGLAAHTAGQAAAEAHLQEAGLPAVSVYFGVPQEAPPSRIAGQPIAVRLPLAGEQARPFDDVVLRRLNGDREASRRLAAYLQAWSRLADELGRTPSGAEFADRWAMSLAEARGDERLFARAFPEEDSPGPLLELLWRAMPTSGGLAWLLGVPVIDAAAGPEPLRPAVGQRWLRRDGNGWLTVTDVDAARVVGGLYDEPTATTSLWVGAIDQLTDFELEQPEGLFVATFNVDMLPTTLAPILQQAGIIATRLSRPGDPRADRSLPVGRIEAQVHAHDEDQARAKIIDALASRQRLRSEDITLRPLPRSLEF